jgi:hypothetical protein
MNDALADTGGARDVLHRKIVITVLRDTFDGRPYDLILTFCCYIWLRHVATI